MSHAAAHEIPNDVKLNAFFKPTGNRLLLLIRAPLAAMTEAEFPTRGPGYLDLSRADEALRGAIKVHLTDNITVTENGTPLPAPRVVRARVSLPSDKSFNSYDEALANLEGRRSNQAWSSIGINSSSTFCSNTRMHPSARNSRSTCASTGSAAR